MKKIIVFAVINHWFNETVTINGIFSELNLAETRKKEVEQTIKDKEEHNVYIQQYEINKNIDDTLINLPWQV